MADKDSELQIETQRAMLPEEDIVLSRRASKAIKSYQKNQDLREQGIFTLGGEIFSSITHGLTALAGAAILVLCVVFAVRTEQGAIGIAAVAIFGAVAFIGFTFSTIYHALAINSGKRVMRVLDHTSIYFIIAGTYTPFALIVLAPESAFVGWGIFTLNWLLCIIGATLTAVNREKYKRFAFVCYLIMGWLVLLAVVPLINAMGWGAPTWLLFSGGVAYTLGAVVYKMKGKYTHGVWHLFTMLGLILQGLSVILFMLR